MAFWKIPKIWEGGECWIIGGGPSIPYEFGVPEEIIAKVQGGELPLEAYSPYLSPIHDKHCIAINAACFIGDWYDLIFFGDSGFYWQNRDAVLPIGKLKITSSPNMLQMGRREGIKTIQRNDGYARGISRAPNTLSWNFNSGASAINLAYHFGVRKVYLLGMDMCAGEHDGNQHFHRVYMAPGLKKNPMKLPFRRHLPSFPIIAKDAEELGLEIINVSQRSTITEFKKMTIKEIFR